MECSICLNDISSPTKFKSTDCKHCFHKECMKEWISHGKQTCPNCRTIINQKTLEKLNGGVKVNNEFIIATMDDLQVILRNLPRINTSY